MPDYVALKHAVAITGLHPNTLRKYADRGDIPNYRIPNGDRRFDVSAFVCRTRSVVGYARVSRPRQKEGLDRQVEYIVGRFPGAEIVRDIGSGLSFKRKGLRALLERALRGEELTVVVSHRDRLARFGFDILEWVIRRAGGEVVVLDQISTSPIEELTRDFSAVLAVFSTRIHGLRGYKIPQDLAQADDRTAADPEAVDG